MAHKTENSSGQKILIIRRIVGSLNPDDILGSLTLAFNQDNIFGVTSNPVNYLYHKRNSVILRMRH